MKKYLAALVAAASLTALTTACSQDGAGHSGMDMGGDAATTTTGAEEESGLPDGVVQADVDFVQGMIPHHQQAVEMADHVLANGVDPEVNALAAQIKDAQAPEIEQMTAWLDDWGQEVMDHGSMDMSGDGMMSESEMAEFNAASGAELDAMFLEMMIRHHEGAISMANTEIDDGSDADAITLAKAIVATQQTEIDEMKSLLDQLASA